MGDELEKQNEFEDLVGDYFDEPVEELVEEEPQVEAEPESEPESEAEPVEQVDPEAEPEPVAEAEADEDLDEFESLKSQNAALLEHIEKLSEQVVSGKFTPQPATKPVVDEPKPQAQAQPVAQPAGPVNFLGDLTVEEMLDDPAKLNMVLSRVLEAAQERSANLAAERTLRAVPEMVVGYITRHAAMNKLVEDFYREHPDLSNVKQTVAAVANTVHSENPDWGVDKVFSEAAGRTRRLLGLHKQRQAQAPVAGGAKKPAFAKSKGARKEAPKLDAVQKEINDLLVDV